MISKVTVTSEAGASTLISTGHMIKTRNSAEISWQARDQETETSDMVIKIRLTYNTIFGTGITVASLSICLLVASLWSESLIYCHLYQRH